MSRLPLLAAALVCACLAAFGQGQRFRVMTYNVENLFDTLATPGRDDAAFTPRGDYAWTSARYFGKLGRLARVIAAVGGTSPADLVALVEVENDSVLTHLTRRTQLVRLGYEYVMTHGEDVRGINVALLYQPHRFRPVGVDTVRVSPTAKALHPTRDVLHVAGELVTGDTLDIFVCHFPSRRGSRPAARYRMAVARAVRTVADSLMRCRQTPLLLLTGDFNTFLPEPCLTEGLGALLPAPTPAQPSALYLLSHGLHAAQGVRGTYKYQGEWNQLDHFIVSGGLLVRQRPDAPFTAPDFCRIADFPFLLQTERNGEGVRPFRTYLGTFYQGGFSDHLPLVLDLFY